MKNLQSKKEALHKHIKDFFKQKTSDKKEITCISTRADNLKKQRKLLGMRIITLMQ